MTTKKNANEAADEMERANSLEDAISERKAKERGARFFTFGDLQTPPPPTTTATTKGGREE